MGRVMMCNPHVKLRIGSAPRLQQSHLYKNGRQQRGHVSCQSERHILRLVQQSRLRVPTAAAELRVRSGRRYDRRPWQRLVKVKTRIRGHGWGLI